MASYEARDAVATLITEDRVPQEVLEQILTDYGDQHEEGEGEVIVIYNARVYVHVNDGDITNVVIDDEGAQLDRTGTVDMNASSLEHIDGAINVTERDDWPAWSFGS